MRQMSQVRMAEETRKLTKRPKLYQELEKKFEEGQQILEQEKLEKLKEMKMQYKQGGYSYGIENEDMGRGKYDELLRDRKNEYKRKRGGLDLAGVADYDSGSGLPHQYKSKFYDEVVSQEKEQKSRLESEKVMKKKLQEKAGSYARYVKEMYWPQVSDQKKDEMEHQILGLKHQARENRNNRISIPASREQRMVIRNSAATADNKAKSKNMQSYQQSNQLSV